MARTALTAPMAVSNTASTESPAMSIKRPWLASIRPRNTARAASSAATVDLSSAAIRREYPATSATTIAASRCLRSVPFTCASASRSSYGEEALVSFYFDPLCQISLQLSEADAKASQAAGSQRLHTQVMVEMKLGRWQKWEMSLGQGGSIDIDQLQPMSFLMEGPPREKSTFSTCQDAAAIPRQ